MEPMYYIGLDVHKRKISYCVKDSSGKVFAEGLLPATRLDLDLWMKTLPQPWSAAMEATMFTGWIYDHLKPHAAVLKVAHPLMLRAIAAAKKKNDRIDAGKICDCLRCDFLPECYMASTAIRELLARNPDIDEGLGSLLRLCRETVVRLQKTESALVRSLERDPLLLDRVERLMTIPAVGPITALTWALEVGDVQRFSSIRKAFRQHRAAHAAVQTAKQAFTNHADRSGKNGPAQQPGAGHALRQGETERQCQPRHAGSGAQARGLLGCRGSPSKRVPYSRKRKPHRRVAERPEYKEDFFDAWPARSCR